MTFKTRILEFYRSQAFKITVKVSDCIIIRLFSFFCFCRTLVWYQLFSWSPWLNNIYHHHHYYYYYYYNYWKFIIIIIIIIIITTTKETNCFKKYTLSSGEMSGWKGSWKCQILAFSECCLTLSRAFSASWKAHLSRLACISFSYKLFLRSMKFVSSTNSYSLILVPQAMRTDRSCWILEPWGLF